MASSSSQANNTATTTSMSNSLRGAFAPPGVSKQKDDAKKWFDTTGLDGYLSALCTKLAEEKPKDPQAFMLRHLVQHCSLSQLEEAGLTKIEQPPGTTILDQAGAAEEK
ncbi:unnamed protein product [Amoebophrya sp. A120]|nr:unnamed protein product [Amoebophrya sp. A120]|eukprot:GSA120T00019764001.1